MFRKEIVRNSDALAKYWTYCSLLNTIDTFEEIYVEKKISSPAGDTSPFVFSKGSYQKRFLYFQCKVSIKLQIREKRKIIEANWVNIQRLVICGIEYFDSIEMLWELILFKNSSL